MNFSQIIVAIIFISIFLNCSIAHYIETSTIKSENHNIKYTSEYFTIPIETIDTVLYRHFNYTIFKGRECLFLKNDFYNSFDLIDLENKTLVFRKELYDDLYFDTETYGEINSVYFYSPDSIFVLQTYRIAIADTNKIYFTKEINGRELNKNTKFTYRNLNHFPVFYDPSTKDILMQQFCSGCAIHKKEYYSTNVEVSFNLNNNEFTIFPLKYSKKYLDGYYGFANHVYRTVAGENNIYSFPIDPNIYVFNRDQKKIFIYGGRSNSHTTDAQKLPLKNKDDSNIKFRHMASVPYYQEILSDPYRGLYYRFFAKYQPEKNEDGTFNSWGDKELVLMVFNNNFELIKEIDLGQHEHSNLLSFVGKKGLYISQNHYKSKNFEPHLLKFSIYNFTP